MPTGALAGEIEGSSEKVKAGPGGGHSGRIAHDTALHQTSPGRQTVWQRPLAAGLAARRRRPSTAAATVRKVANSPIARKGGQPTVNSTQGRDNGVRAVSLGHLASRASRSFNDCPVLAIAAAQCVSNCRLPTTIQASEARRPVGAHAGSALTRPGTPRAGNIVAETVLQPTRAL